MKKSSGGNGELVLRSWEICLLFLMVFTGNHKTRSFKYFNFAVVLNKNMSDNKFKSENLFVPIALGLGVVALITKLFSNSETDDYLEPDIEALKDKKIFISFAKKDDIYRDYLVEQAEQENSPFDFVDMSVRRAWKDDEWKEKCRKKIKKCDGMIVLLSKKTWHSAGARWEIKCAIEENINVVGMHIQKNNKGAIPPELRGKIIIEWNWENLKRIIESI